MKARFQGRGTAAPVPGYSNPKRCRTWEHCPALATAVQTRELHDMHAGTPALHMVSFR